MTVAVIVYLAASAVVIVGLLLVVTVYDIGGDKQFHDAYLEGYKNGHMRGWMDKVHSLRVERKNRRKQAYRKAGMA
jgi:hypothetical protein